MRDILLTIVGEAFVDTVRLLPFLFITYLVMEWLEHRTGSRTQAAIRRAGKAGPFIGGVLGIVPQCGFSVAAANLYAGGVITAGTLIAVFLSTSDEMLPIFLSYSVPIHTILGVLALKMIFAIISGLVLDFLYHKLIRKEIRYKNIHIMCESEHCHCEEGIFRSALRHTLQIILFIFLITLVLNGLLTGIGAERLSSLVFQMPVLGELLAGLVGLIPNCAASVVITQMYLQGVMGAGPMMTGLLASAGVGVLILCRMNKRHIKQNVLLIIFLYLASVSWGILIDFLGIAF
ncbi:MAG: arsenic efflux protein [Lachnospiraceae bacterium]|nr:arsenic efflux protein [Lachnospiraceae bacterium]